MYEAVAVGRARVVWSFTQTLRDLIEGKWLKVGHRMSQSKRLDWNQQEHAPGFVTSLSKLYRQCQEHQEIIQRAVVSVDR